MHVVRDSIETRVTHAWDKLKGKDQVLSENSMTCNTGCYTKYRYRRVGLAVVGR